jgi:hypothetical protein
MPWPRTVHAGEEAVPPVLALKMIDPTPLISMVEASPNLMEPFTPESKSEKNSRRPVVVRSTSVEVPAVNLVIVGASAKEGMVDMCRTSPRGKGKAWTFHPIPYSAQRTHALGTEQHPPLLAQRVPAHRTAEEGSIPWPNGETSCNCCRCHLGYPCACWQHRHQRQPNPRAPSSSCCRSLEEPDDPNTSSLLKVRHCSIVYNSLPLAPPGLREGPPHGPTPP